MLDDVAGLIDPDEAATALRSYTSRLCAILRRKPDREATAIGSWTLGDVANHLTWGIEHYTHWIKGAEAPDLDTITNMARWNIETVRGMPPADLPQLADQIETATAEFVKTTSEIAPTAVVRWYAGNRIPVAVAICMRLVEATVHGLDIATAAGQKWRIDPATARTISYGLGYIAPHFVDEAMLDFEGTMRMRIRGGADIYYVVRDHQLWVANSGPRPGWNLSVDPVAWVLVATERRNQWIAALRGKTIGWGRQPALPFKLRAASFQG